MQKNELKIKLPVGSGQASLAIPKDISQEELQVFRQAIDDTMSRLGELNPKLAISGEKETAPKEGNLEPAHQPIGAEMGGFVTSKDDDRSEIAKKAGAFLRSYREKQTIQRMEISEQTGMSYSSVFNLEKGTSVPSVETLARFAAIYGCDVKIAFIKGESKDHLEDS